MSTKRKSSKSAADGGGAGKEETTQLQHGDGGESSSDDESSDDDSLVLEGEIIRNPDVSDSDDDYSSEEEEADNAKQSKKKQKTNNGKGKGTKPKKKASNQPETIQVDFVFCDMNERFFHGVKTLVHRNSVHSPHSSQLADLTIENNMVGTVLSTDQDDNVFGFASVVNLTTNSSSTCIESLKKICLDKCPQQHKPEMETVLSGKTKRPAGFFFQERMVNVPLEITEVLHQQLVLDMDHAVKNARDEDEKKSLDFGAFVRLAPCYSGGGGGANSAIYKYFDDEIFATNAEFVYTFDAPKMFEEDEEELKCSVIVMTKTGHRAAMKELKKMVGN
ncbi:BCP1 family protein [Skeletonema marinoi]|uniref:BCP1 family protein n=3 Tax=Skeletonema marinoi TaxID=267567 RepID=A0AAD9DDG3_9STRA|nr:BCP1 family protein [Skeletonema marinoi]